MIDYSVFMMGNPMDADATICHPSSFKGMYGWLSLN